MSAPKRHSYAEELDVRTLDEEAWHRGYPACEGHGHDTPFPVDSRSALLQAAAESLWAVTLTECIIANDHLRDAYLDIR